MARMLTDLTDSLRSRIATDENHCGHCGTLVVHLALLSDAAGICKENFVISTFVISTRTSRSAPLSRDGKRAGTECLKGCQYSRHYTKYQFFQQSKSKECPHYSSPCFCMIFTLFRRVFNVSRCGGTALSSCWPSSSPPFQLSLLSLSSSWS
jgi:hypothetical protein